MRRVLASLIVVAGLALVVTATGSAAGRAATVKTRHGKLGTFLVGTNGHTLYLFEKDKTKKSTCSGDCATAWPPLLTTGKPKAAGKARASLLGTTKRADGATQVTYKGHRSTTSCRTRRPGTPRARVSTVSAPSGTPCRRQARRSKTTDAQAAIAARPRVTAVRPVVAKAVELARGAPPRRDEQEHARNSDARVEPSSTVFAAQRSGRRCNDGGWCNAPVALADGSEARPFEDRH